MRRLTATLGIVTCVAAVAVGATLWIAAGRDDHEGSAAEEEAAVQAALERNREQMRRSRRTAELEERVAELESDIDAQKAAIDAKKASPPPGPADAQPGATDSGGGDFGRLESRLGGRVGVVYGPLDGQAVRRGSWTTGPAWSTIKVPLAIATYRATGKVTPSMSPAITASDNAAAARLWDSLGTADAAGTKVESVLRSAGDSTTVVQRYVVRSGFSAYGQTNWSLADQQLFARKLACIDGSRSILTLMGQVTASQRWGLGRIGTNQRFKGGWGPDTGGRYLVRQFGVIDLPSGPVAVAIAAESPDGTFESGIASLNEVAAWVASNASGGGRSRCGA